MPYKKISPRRHKDLPAHQRKKVPLRQQTAEVRDTTEKERALLSAMLADRTARAALIRGSGIALTPFASWADFEGDFAVTTIGVNSYPK